VVADSTQTLLSTTYLSAVLLVGLLLDATLGWSWADPIGETGGSAPRQVREAYEPEALGAALDGELTDRADVAHVVLVVHDAGLERGRLLR
jgi:hypothetical protein